jgi:tRNA-binding protein
MDTELTAMARISVDDFGQVEMRAGVIVAVEDFPTARKPSYRLTIDFGPFGSRRSSAAIRPFYSKTELIGRQVVCVMNFPPRQIADFQSEVLTLGVMEHGGRIVLLMPDKEAELGGRIG